VIGDEHLQQQRSGHEEPRHEMTIETRDQLGAFPPDTQVAPFSTERDQTSETARRP
jgi:hypothetical protein